MEDVGEDESKIVEVKLFPWVQSQKKTKEGQKQPADYESITIGEIVDKFGCPRDIVTSYVFNEVEEAAACKSLPFTLLLVVSYAMMVITHMNAETIRSVEYSLVHDIESNANFAFDSDYMGYKGVEDVNSYADFWSFMNKGLIPLLFIQSHAWSEDLMERNKTNAADWHIPSIPYKPPRWGIMINYNRVVGGIRIRQEYAGRTEACDRPATLNKFYGRLCNADLSQDEKYDIDPDMPLVRGTIPDESRTRWLWVYLPVEQVYQDLLEMETSGYLNDRTMKIEVGIPVYNAEFGVHTLVTVNFMFSQGGHIFKRVVPQSCFIDWFGDTNSYAYDGVYVMCIIYIFVNELMEVMSVMRREGLRGVYNDYLGFWNVIDWISVIFGLYILYTLYQTLETTTTLNDAAVKVGRLTPLYGRENITVVRDIVEYTSLLENAVETVTEMGRLYSYYPLVIVFRLFKSFHAQPRLALVTMTMQESTIDLTHFMFVFICILLGFITSAMIIFGRDVEELASYQRAFYYVFRMLVGDNDWDGMSVVGQVLAGLWLMFFTIVVNILLMNMLLAIVMDSYASVKGRMGNAETLFQEIRQQVDRWWAYHNGRYVPLDHVHRILQIPVAEVAPVDVHDLGAEEDEDQDQAKKKPGKHKKDKRKAKEERRASNWKKAKLKPEDLQNLIKSAPPHGRKKIKFIMDTKQARQVLVGAILDYFETNKEESNMYEYIRLANKTEARMRKVHKMENELQAGLKMHSEDQTRSDDIGIEHADVNDLIHCIRREFEEFLHDVNSDRVRGVDEVVRLRAEVSALQKQIPEGASMALVADPTAGRAMAGAVPGIGLGRVGSAERLRGIEEEPMDNANLAATIAQGFPMPYAVEGGTAHHSSFGSGPMDEMLNQRLAHGGFEMAPHLASPSESLAEDWPEDLSMPSSGGAREGMDPGARPWGGYSESGHSYSQASGSQLGGSQYGSDYAESEQFMEEDDLMLDEDYPVDDTGVGPMYSRGYAGSPSAAVPVGMTDPYGQSYAGHAHGDTSGDPAYEFTNLADARDRVRNVLSKHR